MEALSRLLTEAAHLLTWSYEDRLLLQHELIISQRALTDLHQWRETMIITQAQIDTLTTEVAAIKAAQDETALRVGTIQTNLQSVTAEAAALTTELASAGGTFDTSTLDAALASLATEANAIAQTVAAAPPPTIPAPSA